MVQGLGLSAFTAKAPGSIPGQGSKISQAVQHSEKKKKRFGDLPLYLMGFPGGSDGKESACNVGDLGSIPGLGRFPGEGNDYPLQYSGLENSMDRGAWWATVHGVAKSRTQLNNFHFHSVFNKTIFLMKVKDVEEVILIEHMNCTSTNCIY